ncbi:DUF445 family protein [Sulfitobacter sp. HNIBRBA3233]|uniref:DUF445 domain-containing protein n=1 Tax=Sulfitobacter marinivivus TaxID=3158558 RepID=UPI0032DE3EA9
MRHLDPTETEKLRQLNRIKFLATAVLVACFITLIITKLLEREYPAFGIVAAFAEAATIGGIADWYAVVALFKRPLNLPIPHTAIIPNNQHRIADNLGRFINTNFLDREQVAQKLREIDFAGEISHWLSSRSRAQGLAQFIVRFVPQFIQSVDERGLVQIATRKVTQQIGRTDVAPLLSGVLETFTKDGRHQRLLDDLLDALSNFVNQVDTVAIIRTKIKSELPVLFNVIGADSLLLERIIRSATELLEEVQADKDHPLRHEFEEFLVDYVERTRQSKGFAAQVERVKQHILSRPEVNDAAEQFWDELKAFILRDLASDDSVLVDRLAEMLVEIGESLTTEPKLREDINTGMVTVLSNLVEDQRDGVATYVADQVRSWDMQQLIRLIEANVGQDLQYIRFNGMIIGGCVGVLLYAVETLFL